MEEYVKKSEIIKKLEKDIDSLRGYSEEEFPISFGMRLGLDGFKHYVENLNNSNSNTNYDRIKSMSVEKMAKYHARNTTCNRCEARKMCKSKHTDKEFMKLNCVDRFELWLLQEVSENE